MAKKDEVIEPEEEAIEEEVTDIPEGDALDGDLEGDVSEEEMNIDDLSEEELEELAASLADYAGDMDSEDNEDGGASIEDAAIEGAEDNGVGELSPEEIEMIMQMRNGGGEEPAIEEEVALGEEEPDADDGRTSAIARLLSGSRFS